MASSNPFRRKSSALTSSAETTAFSQDRFPPFDAVDSPSALHPPPPTTFYSDQLPEPPVDHHKPKPVKKVVRVLSPPPLSPDSPEWAFSPSPLAGAGHQKFQNDVDPFDELSADDSDREIVPTAPARQNSSRVPANPFSKTLRDIEGPFGKQELETQRKEEGVALKAGIIARRSLDVNSFKRLLMTGNSGSDSSPTPPKDQSLRLGHHRSATEAFNTSQQTSTLASIRDLGGPLGIEAHESSLISHETSETPSDEVDDGSVSDSSMSVQMARDRGKKPPPPPSSRHGKSIKLELRADGEGGETVTARSSLDTNMNKPLPPAPVRRSFEEDAESPFDKEAAGKTPEIEPSAPTIGRSVSGNSNSNRRKAVPAPPPPRGHARAESKAYGAGAQHHQSTAQQQQHNHNHHAKGHEEDPPSRSSLDSTRSRSERNRPDSHGNAAMSMPMPPPPPRRSFVGSRQSVILSPSVPILEQSPEQTSSSSSASTPYVEPDRSGTSPPAHSHLPRPASALEPAPSRDASGGSTSSSSKLSAPPPPPARNPSVRRPASVRSMESTSRRVSAETKLHSSIAPPPPPRRQRGNSRSSVEGQQSATPSGNKDSGVTPPPPVPKEGMTTTPGAAAEGVALTASEPTDTTSTVPAPQSGGDMGKGVDILADLDALQREVDALRGKLR